MRHITFTLTIFLPNLLFARSFDLHAPYGFITINSGQGGFTAPLDPGDRFSRYHDAAGDLNGDGVIVRVPWAARSMCWYNGFPTRPSKWTWVTCPADST